MLVRRVGRDVRLSRTQAQQWIERRPRGLNGRRPAVRRNRCPRARRRRDVAGGHGRRSAPRPRRCRSTCCYEDEQLLAVNKPAGVVVHPTYKHASHTVINAVLWRLRNVSDARPGVLTRLDKDTSGLVLVALYPAVHAARSGRARRAGRVRKRVRGRRRRQARAPPRHHPAAARARSGGSPPGGASPGRCGQRDPLRGTVHRRRGASLVRASWSRAARTRSACTWPRRGGRSSATGRTARQAMPSPGRRLHAWRVELRHPITGRSLRSWPRPRPTSRRWSALLFARSPKSTPPQEPRPHTSAVPRSSS